MGIHSKRRWVRVAIQDEAGHTVFDDRIERLALPEDVTLSLCLEFFGDPAPCEIHRGAAVSRALSLARSASTRLPMPASVASCSLLTNVS